jgi:DMSO/TMAO reductase YedYZ molybdopterin-dependent catalytic subunit
MYARARAAPDEPYSGAELPARHGAPLRARGPRQLGYKSVKHLSRIKVVDRVKDIGKGLGGANVEDGFSWYVGI